MFMHKAFVEMRDLMVEIRDLTKENYMLKDKLERVGERHTFEIEKTKFECAKSMQKDLIESDIQRVRAIAKLETYMDMDTQDERKHIQEMLEKAIDALGKRQVTINNQGE